VYSYASEVLSIWNIWAIIPRSCSQGKRSKQEGLGCGINFRERRSKIGARWKEAAWTARRCGSGGMG
jgi:hypothetical protein